MKACPFCAEQIQDAAIKCKHCGSILDNAPAVAPVTSRSTATPPVPYPATPPAPRTGPPAKKATGDSTATYVVLALLFGVCVPMPILWNLDMYVAIPIAGGLTLGAAFAVAKKIGSGWFRVVLCFAAAGGVIGAGMGARSQLKLHAAATEARRQSAQKKVERDAAREAALARFPTLISQARSAADAQQWQQAGDLLDQARQIQPDDRDVAELDTIVAPQLARIRDEEAIANAERVAEDKSACATVGDVAKAWRGLKPVAEDSPVRNRAVKAAKKLENCRKKSTRALRRDMTELRAAAREFAGREYEEGLLDQGLDVRVRVSGKNNTKLKLTWVLFSRVTLHQINKDGTLLESFESMGFKRVTFSDGFGESTYYDLDPISDETFIDDEIRKQGMDEPLSL